MIATAIGFALDTYLVATRPLLAFDVPTATFVQSFPWSPVTWIFHLINETAGYPQGAVGVMAVIVLLIFERRAGYLMALGAISSRIDNEIKVVMARQRPAADLVHIITPAPGSGSRRRRAAGCRGLSGAARPRHDAIRERRTISRGRPAA